MILPFIQPLTSSLFPMFEFFCIHSIFILELLNLIDNSAFSFTFNLCLNCSEQYRYYIVFYSEPFSAFVGSLTFVFCVNFSLHGMFFYAESLSDDPALYPSL